MGDRLVLRMVQRHSMCRSYLQFIIRTYPHLTVFLTEAKGVFDVSILSLACSGNGYASDHISYRHTSTCRPCHTLCVTVVLFVCPSVHTTLALSGGIKKHIDNMEITIYHQIYKFCKVFTFWSVASPWSKTTVSSQISIHYKLIK